MGSSAQTQDLILRRYCFNFHASGRRSQSDGMNAFRTAPHHRFFSNCTLLEQLLKATLLARMTLHIYLAQRVQKIRFPDRFFILAVAGRSRNRFTLFFVVKSEFCDLKIPCGNSVNHLMLINLPKLGERKRDSWHNQVTDAISYGLSRVQTLNRSKQPRCVEWRPKQISSFLKWFVIIK